MTGIAHQSIILLEIVGFFVGKDLFIKNKLFWFLWKGFCYINCYKRKEFY